MYTLLQLFGSTTLRTVAPRAVDAAKGSVKGTGLTCPPRSPATSAAVQASNGMGHGRARASMASRMC